MDPTPSSLDPYASMLKDSAWAPVSFHIDPKVDSDLAAVMAMPAGDVQLDDDPAWTPPADDGVPFGYSGKDASGARVGGGYTQGYNQGTSEYMLVYTVFYLWQLSCCLSFFQHDKYILIPVFYKCHSFS